MDRPVYLKDILPSYENPAANMTQEERRRFIEEVESEMDRLGFTGANEITARSTLLTAEDYAITINAKPRKIDIVGRDGKIVDVI